MTSLKKRRKEAQNSPKIAYFVTMMTTIVPVCYYAVGVWRPLAAGNKKSKKVCPCPSELALSSKQEAFGGN